MVQAGDWADGLLLEQSCYPMGIHIDMIVCNDVGALPGLYVGVDSWPKSHQLYESCNLWP